jgi:hypothetical protein
MENFHLLILHDVQLNLKYVHDEGVAMSKKHTIISMLLSNTSPNLSDNVFAFPNEYGLIQSGNHLLSKCCLTEGICNQSWGKKGK